MTLSGVDAQSDARALRVAAAYLAAKDFVISRGFESEIHWQEQRRIELVGEVEFLREVAWVILNSGFRESIVRSIFPKLSRAFHDWKSAAAIVGDNRVCRRKALMIFGSGRKIDAILDVANIVHTSGFGEVKRQLLRNPVEFIRTLPFMGDVTSLHLAKNLGVAVVKPDRHLVRVAQTAGFESPDGLCRAIWQIVGDHLSVIDLVIWRYATLRQGYTRLFQC